MDGEVCEKFVHRLTHVDRRGTAGGFVATVRRRTVQRRQRWRSRERRERTYLCRSRVSDRRPAFSLTVIQIAAGAARDEVRETNPADFRRAPGLQGLLPRLQEPQEASQAHD